MKAEVRELTNEQYHRAEGLSFSGMKHLMKSVAHYREYLRTPSEPTPAMLLGTAVHSAVLEDGIERGVVVGAPAVDRRTKDGKAQWEAFMSEHRGKIILPWDAFQYAGMISKAVKDHPLAQGLLTGGKAERSIFWTDPETGILCKCRPDFLRDDGVVIDLKVTTDASAHAFQRTVGRFRYEVQSALYLEGVSYLLGVPLRNFVHLVVESEPPFGIAAYVLDDPSLDVGRDIVKRMRHRLASAKDQANAPAYPLEIQNLSVPNWVHYEEIA